MASHSNYRIFSRHGFLGAPVTKSSCLAVIGASAGLLPLPRLAAKLCLEPSSVLNGGEVYRLLSSKLFFSEPSALVSAGLLFYFLRGLERRLGSKRLGSLLLWACLGSSLVEAAALRLFQPRAISSGPYAPLMALLLVLGSESAAVPFARPAGIPISVRLFPAILGLQLWANSAAAGLSCLSGLVVGGGLVASLRLGCLPSLVPDSLAELIRALPGVRRLSRLGEDSTGELLPAGATEELQRADAAARLEQQLIYHSMQAHYRQAPEASVGPDGLPYLRRLFRPSPRPQQMQHLPSHHIPQPASPPPVREADVSQLVEMGFGDRGAITAALRDSHGDIATATAILLQQQ